MKKFLHLLPDNGYMNSFIEVAEKIAPGKNTYIINAKTSFFSKSDSAKKVQFINVIVAGHNGILFNDAVGDIKQYEKVFIHFLSSESIDFVIKYKNTKLKFIWLFWGADLYSPFNYFKNSLYDELSLNYFLKNNTYTTSGKVIYDKIKAAKKKFYDPLIEKSIIKNKAEAIARLNGFAHFTRLDFEEVKKQFKTRAVYLPFFYYEYDYSKLYNINTKVTSVSENIPCLIQLGNSASLSNNHFSALRLLEKYKNENISVICPLSYGDGRYRNAVIKTGHKLLGNKFVPLTDFLPKEEYASLLSSIQINIMNHMRSEAAGNVKMMLAMRKKVVLNEKSTLYRFLKSEGLILFDISSQSRALLNELSEEEGKQNQARISDLFSYQKACDYIQHLMEVEL